jgi:hypothetical protein
MRVLSVVFASAFLAGVVSAQAPAPAAPARQAKPAPARPAGSRPTGDLAQVMRGLLFPNSNLIFDAQSNDPGAPKKTEATGGGASATFANIYTGWEVVENAGILLAESVDLILKPGRLCSNGKPVPVQRADFRKFAQGLREAGRATLEAAKTKSQDKVVEVTDRVAEACANCHEVYRDKGPAGSPERCTP